MTIEEQLKLLRPVIAKVGLHSNTWTDETISPAMSVIKHALHQIYDQAKAKGYQEAIEDMNEDKAYKENKL